MIWITRKNYSHDSTSAPLLSLPGLKVDGLYRRCGLATKISCLVEALSSSPTTTPLETDEEGLLDAAGALKQYVRQQVVLIPETHRKLWVEAAGTLLLIFISRRQTM